MQTLRKEASALGEPRYFTGKPCKNGHISERNTKSGHCMDCNRMWDKTLVRDWKSKNRKHYNEIEKNRAVITRKRRRLEAV